MGLEERGRAGTTICALTTTKPTPHAILVRDTAHVSLRDHSVSNTGLGLHPAIPEDQAIILTGTSPSTVMGSTLPNVTAANLISGATHPCGILVAGAVNPVMGTVVASNLISQEHGGVGFTGALGHHLYLRQHHPPPQRGLGRANLAAPRRRRSIRFGGLGGAWLARGPNDSSNRPSHGRPSPPAAPTVLFPVAPATSTAAPAHSDTLTLSQDFMNGTTAPMSYLDNLDSTITVQTASGTVPLAVGSSGPAGTYTVTVSDPDHMVPSSNTAPLRGDVDASTAPSGGPLDRGARHLLRGRGVGCLERLPCGASRMRRSSMHYPRKISDTWALPALS